MTPYFAGQPVLRFLFVGTVVVWALSELRQALKQRSEAAKGDRGSHLAIIVSVASAFALAALARARVPSSAIPDGPVTFGIDLAILWFGVGLRWWSFRTLGRYFTFDVMTSADQPVITSGPYRIVRHPSYAGLWLVLIAFSITYANWLSLLAVILLPLAGIVYRIHVEEAALSAALGNAYISYAAHRKRLIPFLW